MKRYALVVEYNGREMAGFQTQVARVPLLPPAGRKRATLPTVQEELEKTLSRLFNEVIKIDGAGRTDAGVHATGQVVAFNAHNERSIKDVLRGTNALLVPWIRVLKAYAVDLDFSPRFQAQRRIYHYLLLPGQGRCEDAIWSPMAWVIHEDLDVQAMSAAAQLLLGKHDFRAYSRGELPAKNTQRQLTRVEIRAAGGSAQGFRLGPLARLAPLLCFEIEADAFLRRMVRQLVGNLVKVGQGDWAVDKPRTILEGLNPKLGATPAPAAGLYLVDVCYPHLD